MIHRFTIPAWRPARLNELLSGSWHQAARRKKSDRVFIATYAQQAGIPHATGKRRVSLEITLKGRQQQVDPDGYWKSLLDALVHARMLIDDRSEFCELGSVTYSRNGEARTTIVLEEI